MEFRTAPGFSKKNTLAMAICHNLQRSGGALLLSLSTLVLADSTFGPGSEFELSSLDGGEGFVIHEGDRLGDSVSGAGDINGDGVDDLIIGAAFGEHPNGQSTGVSYVVFGNGSVGSAGTIELSALGSNEGIVLNGIDGLDKAGASVSSAGDINGDGVDDLIIGAPFADPNRGTATGESYVVFGSASIGGSIELSDLDGANGFVLNGFSHLHVAGSSVSGAGDINGDGMDDLIIGAPGGSPIGESFAGESFVVFGGESVGISGTIELFALNGSDGFVLTGIDRDDYSGSSVSGAGDINGDGFEDLIIGARRADPNGIRDAGESYVVFGGASVGSSGVIELSALNGIDGFVLNGVDVDDFSGSSVSGAGDINGDGMDDLIVSASHADPNGNAGAGESYVVFGSGGVGSSGTIELSALNGSDGFVLSGVGQNAAQFGMQVSGAGDINGDGVDDLIIGVSGANPHGISSAGESYVVFGGASVGSSGAIELSALNGSDGFVFNGAGIGHRSGTSVSGAGDINNDGLDDLIISALNARLNGSELSGASYVVFGKKVPVCNDRFVTVDLNFGETPGPGPDVVLGTPGNDDIRGRAGNDTICGEGGDDFLHGNSGDDLIDGGDGVDEVRGGMGNDVLFAGSGATVGTPSFVFGGNGDDEINGGEDADDLRGGRGIDTINGFDGDDVMAGDTEDDTLNGGAGNDELRGGQGNDALYGDGGEDFLSGGGGLLDVCDGGGATDIATSSCESVVNLP